MAVRLLGNTELIPPSVRVRDGFGVLFSTNVLLHPALTRDFARVAGALDERGALNPSTLALIRDLTGSPVSQDVLGISAASGPWY